MALEFVKASSKALVNTTPTAGLYSNSNSTFFCWFRVDNVAGVHAVMSVGDKDTTTSRDKNLMEWNQADGVMTFRFAGAASGTSHAHGTTVAHSTWSSVGYVYRGTSDRGCWVNGVEETDSTSSGGAPTNVDRLTFGFRYSSGSAVNYFDGLIAYPTFWSAELTDEEMTSLNNGVHPMLIRPMSIISHWPLDRINGTTIYNDNWQANPLTQSGSPARFLNPGHVSSYSHSPIYYRPRL